MKKVFALVLALILALSLFACGKKSEDTGTAAGAETKPVSETATENTRADAPEAEETPAATDTAEDPAQAEAAPTENTTPSGSSSASNSSNTGSSSNSSSSSSSSGSSTSAAAPAGASGSSSGSSSAAAPVSSPVSQPVHEHSWQPVYREVQVADTAMKCFTRCSVCDIVLVNPDGSEPNGDSLQHELNHMLAGEGGGTYEKYEPIKGTHTEKELISYTCTCGATKNP